MRDHSSHARVRANDSGVLIDAAEYYRAVYDAALAARHSIALSGWQFDSRVPLLRGADADRVELPVELLPFLEALVARNHRLEVHILAWDFSALYVFERELFQRIKFGWSTSPRIHFQFDGVHPVGASHHQKLVVIDGALAFSGGMDLCDHRWDDRQHRADHPDRVTLDGEAYEPYHDVQAVMTGPAAEAIARTFEVRWKRATGEDLALPRGEAPPGLQATVRMGEAEIALTETYGAVPQSGVEQQEDIALKYERVIASAERLVYIENQYYTADRVQRALEARLGAADRPPLDVVLVLPKKASALKEIVALGIRQSKLLNDLGALVEPTEHRLGVYFSCPAGASENATYIHSKILIVDDIHLTVGSANTTNRSMGVDTELDVDWESPDLEGKIREVRHALLREHTGREDLEAPLGQVVTVLDEVCRTGRARLQRLSIDEIGLGLDLDADDLPDMALDPSRPMFVEALGALSPDRDRSVVERSLAWLHDRVRP